MREGDKNTKYFHRKASARKRKNKIWGVENRFGKWTEDEEEVEKEFCEFFHDLFTTSSPSQDQIAAALSGLESKMNEEMRRQLDEPFIVEEIESALKQMCLIKASRPDGFPVAFFQKHWQVVSKGVITTCLHILNDQGTIEPLNHTYIVLIPKVSKPGKVSEYRPISLCNVIYRIVTKVISIR